MPAGIGGDPGRRRRADAQRLRYKRDGDRLASGETLSTATFTATGLTNVASSVTSDGFAVWKFQGATVNTDYEIACSVTTSLGNTLKETIVLRCRAG